MNETFCSDHGVGDRALRRVATWLAALRGTAAPALAAVTLVAISVAVASGQSIVPDLAKAAPPTFSLPAGNYLGPQTVKISDTTAKATIYYTTNGATPSTTSAKYLAPVTVAATATLKAIAVATGSANSAVASVTYTIAPAVVPFYIPGIATPATPTGASGLFVVPSNAPTSTPTFVSTTTPVIIGLSLQISLTSAGVGAFEPYALVYLGKGGDLLYHVYGLALDATKSKPQTAQISTIGLPALSEFCDATSGQTNVVEPATLFFLLQTAGPNRVCGDSDDVYQVVHYRDGAATPPKIVAVHTAKFAPIYSTSGGAPGPLGGIVLLDPLTGHLDFYADSTFTAPKLIANGVASYQNLALDLQTPFAGKAGGFFIVTPSIGPQSLYRISTAGTAVVEYTAAGNLQSDVTDLKNLYFIDNLAATQTESIWQEPLIGGAPVKLLTRGYAANQYDSLFGADGVDLVIGSHFFTSDTSTLSTLPVGKLSTSEKQIGAYNGYLTGELYATTPGSATSSSVIFANVSLLDAKGFHYSSEAIQPNGTVVSALTANSQYLGGVGPATGTVFQVRGITDLDSGYGGATLYSVKVGSGAATPFTTPAGSDFVVPASVMLLGLHPIASFLGIGGAATVGTGAVAGADALVYTFGSTVVDSIALQNTGINLF
jgi:hypothetical protein